jgi:hypothetical protein
MRRILESHLTRLVRRVIKEETSGLGDFIETLRSNFNMSDELVGFVRNFIENSNCNKIEFAKFKYAALGAALHNGVLINNVVLNSSLEVALFSIFHEIAHQYQYKKYGIEKMYEFYNDEISVIETAKFMKEVETVADSFASRKIRELQKMGLISRNFVPIEIYKNVSESQLAFFINNIRSQLRSKNITSPDDISEFWYNLLKNQL